jgi:hypothetical protein
VVEETDDPQPEDDEKDRLPGIDLTFRHTIGLTVLLNAIGD